MFLLERYRRNPSPRRPSPPPSTDNDSPPEPDLAAEDWDDSDNEEQLSDADFLRGLRADIEGVEAGTVKSIAGAMRPALQDRPWGRRHKRRDRNGKVF